MKTPIELPPDVNKLLCGRMHARGPAAYDGGEY